MKSCPQCGTLNPDAAQVCACGSELSAGARRAGPTTSRYGPSYGPYPVLWVAVLVFRASAAILVVIGVAGSADLFSEGVALVTLTRVLYLGLQVFGLWVSGDVLRILLDIHENQGHAAID